MTNEIPLGPVPDGWSNDPLCEYFDAWRRNQLATFQQRRPAFNRVRDIDAIFLRLAENLDDTEHTAPALFFYRAHAAFRAAVGLAMAGQNVEVFPLLRNCLEQSLYAYYIFKSPPRHRIWADRHESADALKAVKKTFVLSDMLAAYAIDHANDGSIARALYESTIDWGAHPNTQGIMQAVEMEHSPGSIDVVTQYLDPGTLQHDSALKDAARVGACVLGVFAAIFEQRFALLGLRDDLLAARQGL